MDFSSRTLHTVAVDDIFHLNFVVVLPERNFLLSSDSLFGCREAVKITKHGKDPQDTLSSTCN